MLTTIKKTYSEFWGYYWRITHRHSIEGIFEWDANLVSLIESSCGLSSGMKILDLACAGGDQARVFAERGYRVTGIDIVPGLIEYARNAFQKSGLTGEFIVGDMRDLPCDASYDACAILSGSFGFFSDEENEELLVNIGRTLKADGRLFLNYLPTESMSGIKHERHWNRIDGGYSLGEVWYDSPSGTYRSTHMHIMDSGSIIVPVDEEGYHANEVIRCYSRQEMDRILKAAGFIPTSWHTRGQIDDPDLVPAASDVYGSVAARIKA